MASISRVLEKRLKLRVNREKSAVAYPWRHSFLGYTVTWNKRPRPKVSAGWEAQIKRKLKQMFRRGRNLKGFIEELEPVHLG